MDYRLLVPALAVQSGEERRRLGGLALRRLVDRPAVGHVARRSAALGRDDTHGIGDAGEGGSGGIRRFVFFAQLDLLTKARFGRGGGGPRVFAQTRGKGGTNFSCLEGTTCQGIWRSKTSATRHLAGVASEKASQLSATVAELAETTPVFSLIW